MNEITDERVNGTTVHVEIRDQHRGNKTRKWKTNAAVLTVGLARVLELGVQCGSEFPGSPNKKSFGGKNIYKSLFSKRHFTAALYPGQNPGSRLSGLYARGPEGLQGRPPSCHSCSTMFHQSLACDTLREQSELH